MKSIARQVLRLLRLTKTIEVAGWFCLLLLISAVAGFERARPVMGDDRNDPAPARSSLATEYAARIRPIVVQYCFACHSQKVKRGDLDLEQFISLDQVRQKLSSWKEIAEKLENGEMPPKSKPQPRPEERQRLVAWIHRLLDAEARVQAGDPGRVVLRRLSNAEYNYTIRDLTGVDLQPAREFPVDGAAGEGFTNTGDALVISNVLLDKYLAAAEDIAAHAVLLPSGFRFSVSKDQQVWRDEVLKELHRIHAQFSETEDGLIPLQRYLTALIHYRDQPDPNRVTLDAIATREKLSAKYLASLWHVLNAVEKRPSVVLDQIRSLWRKTNLKNVPELAAEIGKWQHLVWAILKGTNQVGAERYNSVGQKPWQRPVTPDLVQKAKGEDRRRLEQEVEEFRRWFPLSLCYGKIVPSDPPVTLWLFYREDEPLRRLMLDDQQRQHLDRLWSELHYITQDALKVEVNFDLVYEVATEFGPASAQSIKIQREPVRRRAQEFQKELLASEPRHLKALLDFAARAYRRPLQEKERNRLLELYKALRRQGSSHTDTFRVVLARILVSPFFLYRIEHSPAGKEAGRISDWELATRLSYFLWSSLPDAELSRIAREGRLHDDKVLCTQVGRMLKDERMRRLAIEFGTQWIHVRNFDEYREKSEKLFPMFDEKLRRAIYEESILFFQDLFQNDRSLLEMIDGDATFLNETLAKHYGIPKVSGPQWRRVDGLKQYGRGGLLTLASVLAKESGAARTSPVLRGYWVLEALLGEKLSKPPANVPTLPEEGPGSPDLTMRQLVEKHTRVAECAVCHQRIDPLGFALEQYDPIGRFCPKDRGGRPFDTHVKLKNGIEFDGAEGLRQYLKKRQKSILTNFCRKLLGFTLGRTVTLSDEPLLADMYHELQKHDYRVSAAMMCIVRSKQFHYTRGREVAREE